ncbi:MAG: restriction endonuclease subunit S [Rhodocyclaceae bacterium]|nr:restriction endonuclease subunit S [Rhodocyclaceae bacterium]MCA3059889.1 restriction endonuclease subunit S [Rhodocyclaceae bacterium]MCA3081250.1 restriction endonuclease subunit S [Rhodocyclaceae bacterium]
MRDLQTGDIFNDAGRQRVELDTKPEQYTAQRGDLIFRSRGTANQAFLVAEDLQAVVVAAPLVIIRVISSDVLPGYLQWFLNHEETQRKFAKLPMSTAGRLIGLRDLRDLRVEIPSLEIQHNIQAVHGLLAKEAEIARRLSDMQYDLREKILMQHVKGN